VFALGCETSTAPPGHLAFTRDVDNAGRTPLVAMHGAIEQRASFHLPCIPYHLTAELAARGPDVIEIHIDGVMGVGCWDMVDSTDYVAQVTGLDPGTYTLRVIHSWSDTGRAADTVVNTSVVVP
jgi:hypothetical protein